MTAEAITVLPAPVGALSATDQGRRGRPRSCGFELFKRLQDLDRCVDLKVDELCIS